MPHPTRWTLALAVILSLLTPHRSAAQPGSVIDHLEGTWTGNVELFNTEAAFRLEWEWVLGDRFLRLDFENRMRNPGGEDRVFTATAFYKPIDEGVLEGTCSTPVASCNRFAPLPTVRR